MTKQALIIFVRKPEKGKVKTRLAATIGDEAALSIYKKLLAHTISVAKEAAVDTFVFYAGQIEPYDEWNQVTCYKRKQAGTDLGSRMQAAFTEVFRAGFTKAVIIGSDCPALTADHIHAAFAGLEQHDVVIGPANDGGYYLLGLKKIHAALFEKIAWSTATVFQDTLRILKEKQLSFCALPVLTDVDEEKDLPPEWRLDTELRNCQRQPHNNESTKKHFSGN